MTTRVVGTATSTVVSGWQEVTYIVLFTLSPPRDVDALNGGQPEKDVAIHIQEEEPCEEYNHHIYLSTNEYLTLARKLLIHQRRPWQQAENIAT